MSTYQNDNFKALFKLAQELEKCNTMLEHLNHFSNLNCFQSIAKIVQELRFAMQSQWRRFVSSIERDGHKPNFTDLKRFIVNKADVAKYLYATHTHVYATRIFFTVFICYYVKSQNGV